MTDLTGVYVDEAAVHRTSGQRGEERSTDNFSYDNKAPFSSPPPISVFCNSSLHAQQPRRLACACKQAPLLVFGLVCLLTPSSWLLTVHPQCVLTRAARRSTCGTGLSSYSLSPRQCLLRWTCLFSMETAATLLSLRCAQGHGNARAREITMHSHCLYRPRRA
jgi:hypothetical protein